MLKVVNKTYYKQVKTAKNDSHAVNIEPDVYSRKESTRSLLTFLGIAIHLKHRLAKRCCRRREDECDCICQVG